MQILEVNLGERSYPIYIGADLLGQPEILHRYISGKQVLWVSNETVAPLYLERAQTMLPDFQQEAVVLPDGEQYKTLEVLGLVFDALLKHRYERNCTLIALGGGVVGDMTGFAAACYQRGVHFIQVPTTLLAQVDSSVGGKTGVNHPLGKNMIGAFYQPRCVLVDTNTLRTLPDRELSAGIAEIVKYGLIRDIPFLGWLEKHMEDLLNRDPKSLTYAILQSCRNKAEIVAEDERENGVRALLNLGHTFGHAIETGLGYGVWLHGEAVAAGMAMAADLSARLGWLSTDQVKRVTDLLLRARLPVQLPASLSGEDFLRLMAVDKKVRDGRLRLILLEDLGVGRIVDNPEPEKLRATLGLR
ncbi:MAG: 3-dehydroquinate synthase [Gammaproteobacteria bacterium]|nr:3-dehydroquinate synthase [Gammaproteobacteria bacterium]MCP5424666.1 3-dehydroquinate synthase [Gammaproteobacteria bacterium]